MSPAIRPGTTFAGYRVESLVSRGGMGVVYRATDLSLDRPVALKLIAPELAEDERFRARFLKEPRLAAALDHPNVVPIYEAGERDGRLYLAMRYVEGHDLKTVLAGDRLPPGRAFPILAQIASALDAAHRRGLVHRDVKPANVLLDENEHAYLTDFGITKQVGGPSTDTGRMAGTLDYLAPEQIRGEAIDGRTDCYSLACVLYECLSGRPPFRRATEAETMWAHMQDPPGPIRGFAALAPVLEKGLAKERDERYGSCAELVEAAYGALGLAAPGRFPLVPPALVRRRRTILVAGVLLLAGSIAAGVLALTGGDGGAEPLGNGVAAIDPTNGEVASLTGSEAVPGNVAVGGGAVWVVNTADETVSRVDPKTKEVEKTFKTGGVPSELAVGEGALWVGNAGGSGDTNAIVSIARVDPESGRVTRTVRLPGRDSGDDSGFLPSAGLPRLAAGAGAVWVLNPGGSVSRIDPDTGKLVATIDADGLTIAAGDEGVWLPGGDRPSVMRIDPRTNRVSERIPVSAQGLWGVAVGAGSVWATAPEDGLVFRIEPGPNPTTRTIDVGVGVTLVDFGEGSLWAGNYIDGRVSRIDPATNSVAARTTIGAPQALDAGAGAAWVSVAGGTRAGALPASVCGEVASGPAEPDVLIASDLPLQGPLSADPRAVASAIRFVVERRGFKAGEHTVGYQSCDVSTSETAGFEFRRCAANANAYAHAEQLVAVIGSWSSYCSEVEIPIVNRAPGGPVAMISPSNTGPSLTRGGPLAETRGEPEVFYPTGVRNFVRVVPREDVLGAAHAVLAKQLGLRRVYVLNDSAEDTWRIVHADPFRRAAIRLGLRVAGSQEFDPEAKSYDLLARRVARSRAEGIFIAGFFLDGGARLLKALRERLGSEVKLMVAEPFAFVPDLLEGVGSAAHGLYISGADVPLGARQLSPAGRRFARDFGALTPPSQFVLPAAQAAEIVLEAIERSDGTRASVLEELRATEVKDGILGSFRFDRNGDITPAHVPIYRVTGRTPPGAGIYDYFEGSVVDRVVTVR